MWFNTRIGYGGFDNGTYVKGTSFTVKAEPGLVYSFKVTAVNKGGRKFPFRNFVGLQGKEK